MVTTRSVHDSVWALLEAVGGGITAYDGDVPKTPPLDGDGAVGAYAVLYFSPGRRYANALNGVQASVDGSFQVTCAGADPTKALRCVDKVLDALLGVDRRGSVVDVDGVPRRIRARENDPGPLRCDKGVTPVRFYAPLHFLLLIP
ncbi:MAG: hypothetical protein ACRDV2_16170 [Actinomycetes bacterium]